MAASLDVGWNSSPPQLPSSSQSAPRKRRWDDDSHLMLQLMLGQVEFNRPTLDLLGGSSCPQPLESLELDLESPLPSGWEKCLDLKTGSIFYLNRNTGFSTYGDPRKSMVADRRDPRKPLLADLNSPPSPSASELTSEGSAAKVADECTLKTQNAGGKCVASTLATPAAADRSLKLRLSLSVDLNLPAEDQSLEASPIPAPEQAWLSDRESFQISSHRSMSTTSSSSSSSPSVISFQELDGPGETRDRRLGKASEVESVMSDVVPSMITVGCAKCLMFVMLSRTDPRCPKCGTCALLDFLQPVVKRSRLGFST